MPEKSQVTVAELIEILRKLPQESLVFVDGDYGYHLCEGASLVDGDVRIEIG